MRNESWRSGVVGLTALFILAPVGLILWQSFLTDAFFNARAKLAASTYAFVLSDPGFRDALGNTLILSAGMVLIAVPAGALLAFGKAATRGQRPVLHRLISRAGAIDLGRHIGIAGDHGLGRADNRRHGHDRRQAV